MSLSKEYIRDWFEWHNSRIQDLNRPYGFLSVVSQDWLREGGFFVSEFVPGSWHLKDGEIYYYPDPRESGGKEALLVDGKAARSPTHIPHGVNKNSGTGSGVAIFYKELEVETITRLNSRDQTIYAVRVRDPREAARQKFDDIETFPLSENWIIPAKYTPTDVSLHHVPTVEDGIFEANFTIGTISLHIDGRDFELEVNGHRAGSPSTGYFSDATYVHFGDLTNGRETYGGGRYIGIDPTKLAEIESLDFNRAVSFPCALSTFVACASTPPSNRLPLRVTAGEYAPPVPHERIQTYKG